METEIRYYYSINCKDDILEFLNSFEELKCVGTFYECTDQWNHPMKEFDFYGKEIDGRFRVRKTTNESSKKCMISWKRRAEDFDGDVIHREYSNEDVEVVLDEYPFGLCIEIECKNDTRDEKEVVEEWVHKLNFKLEEAYKLSWDDKYAELCEEQNKPVEKQVRFDKDMPSIDTLFIR